MPEVVDSAAWTGRDYSLVSYFSVGWRYLDVFVGRRQRDHQPGTMVYGIGLHVGESFLYQSYGVTITYGYWQQHWQFPWTKDWY